MTIFLQGFALQASLILDLGSQNIFVLNSGLRKQRHLLVAFICALCDAVLILVGVLGVATIFVQNPLLQTGHGAELDLSTREMTSTRQVVLTTLAFSLLNPHVYLDTVVLIGWPFSPE